MLDKQLLRSRLAFIRQGSEVERYHTKRMLQRNDVGHHSFHVAWLAWLMAPSSSPQELNGVVMAALTHDLAEHITGDIPSDFKRELQLGGQFGEYEGALLSELGLDYSLSLVQTRVLKMADLMEGAFFCVSEASLGNGRIGVVFKNYRDYLEKFTPFNEAESIIVEYIDELWAAYGVDSAPGWNKTAHKKEYTEDVVVAPKEWEVKWEVERAPDYSLIDTLRREEAEGRATPIQEGYNRRKSAEIASDQPADPSKAGKLGDAPVPEQPVDDAMDDAAQSDLGAEPPSGPANARQMGGDHYKGVGYEHWDLVLDTGMNYFQGCATKYVTRARKHSAGAELNWQKGAHYLDKLEEAVAAERIGLRNNVYSVSDIVSFGVANSLNELEVQVIKDIIGWRLDAAREGLVRLQAGLTTPEMKGGRAVYGEVEA